MNNALRKPNLSPIQAIYPKSSTRGRKKLFATPQALWFAACAYFEWSTNNPYEMITKKVVNGVNYTNKKSTPRPFSLIGFALHAGVSKSYLRNLKWRESKKESSTFLETISTIEQCIHVQQLEGALVGCYDQRTILSKLSLNQNH